MEPTAQSKGAPETEEAAKLHEVAALNHERITGADTVAHEQPDGSKKTDSQLAVQSAKVPTTATVADTHAESEAKAKDPIVKIGDTVRLRIVAAGVVGAALGIVTSVSNLDSNRLGENDEPYITVVYLSSNDRKLLGSANWAQAFTRIGPIHHESSASSQAGQEGTVWTDVIADASQAISLPALELGEDAGKVAYNAEVQRKIANGAGYGPVDDGDVNYQAATASDAAAKGKLVSGQSTRDTTTTIQERINHPMGAVGSPRVPLNNAAGTKVAVGDKRDSLLPTPDETDSNLGLSHALSTPTSSKVGVVDPIAGTPAAGAHSDDAGKSVEEVAHDKAIGVLPAGRSTTGVVKDDPNFGDGHTVVEDAEGNRTSTSLPPTV